ncbi:hypothetical protein FO519_003042 [Halicephalobus sp. NKZ332]|nr:hypothetical protein FO519_003042 [Halicephalobus sp. NKZ332]
MNRLGTSLSRRRGFDDDLDNIDYGSNYGLDPSDDYHLVRPISTADLQDEYPIGDIIPDTPAADEIYHQGNRYIPVHSTNGYDVYELEDEPLPFQDNTTHNDEYYWKEGEKNRTPESPEGRRSLPPFTGETTHQSTYVPHVPKKRDSLNGTPEPRSKIPFYGKTSNQITYTPKDGQRTKKERPKTHLGNNPGNFQGATVSQVSYKKKSARPPTRYVANDHLGVGGEFFAKTTNAADFVNHPRQGKPLRRRHSAPTMQPGFMESKTTNQRAYTPKKASTCPAEKLLLARNQNKLSGRVKNGHFYIPVTKTGKVLQNLTNTKNQNPSKYNPNFYQRNNQDNYTIDPTIIYPKDTRRNNYSPPPAINSPFAQIRPLPSPDPTPRVPTPQHSLPKKRIAAPQRHVRTAAAVGFPIP